MAHTFYKFFTWTAGIDRSTLDTCSGYEKNKHMGIGMLVMIPSVLGLISMSFALSMLTDKWYVIIPLSLVWAVFIIFIDRYLISTFQKKDVNIFIVIGQFLLRLILSIFLGIVVSHPLVLFVLNSSIQQELSDLRLKENEKITDAYTSSLNAVNTTLLNFRKNNIDNLVERINCLESVMASEAAGQRRDITCGDRVFSTSGKPSYGWRADSINSRIKIMDAQRVNAEKDYNELKEQLGKNLESKYKDSENARKGLNENFSYDYLSRVMALSRLWKRPVEGDEISTLVIFLMIFFIFLDILPFLLKVITKPGEYENKIKKAEELNIHKFNINYEREKDIENLKQEKKEIFQRTKLFRMRTSDFANMEEMEEYMNSL